MWINNEKDFQDALDLIKETGKVVFWCIGPGTGKKRVDLQMILMMTARLKRRLLVK